MIFGSYSAKTGQSGENQSLSPMVRFFGWPCHILRHLYETKSAENLALAIFLPPKR
jgi:hypothetical protein